MLLRCTKPRPPRFLGSWMFLVRFSNFRKRVSSFERALFTEGFRTLSRIVARTRGQTTLDDSIYFDSVDAMSKVLLECFGKERRWGRNSAYFSWIDLRNQFPSLFLFSRWKSSIRLEWSSLQSNFCINFSLFEEQWKYSILVLIERRTQKRFKFLEFSGNRRWSTRSEGKGDERKVFEGNFDRC